MPVSKLKPADIQAARERIAHAIWRTPVMIAPEINEMLGLELFFKCEQLQPTGSFKLRGATHAVSLLADDCPGVATHSSGNHGAALARAARDRGLPAHVVMPDNAVGFKVDAVRRYGGEVHFCAPTQQAREAGLAEWVEQGFEPVPPYDDDRIIAGQGTCAMELLEQVDDLDLVIAPVGGGGLLAGTALAVMAHAGQVEVFGAEPSGADDTARSLATGSRVDDHHPDTIADGLRALVGLRNLGIIQDQVRSVVTVSDARIVDAMELAWAGLKQLVEPSGAVALAAVMDHADAWRGKRVGVILSGGNLDTTPLLAHWR